MYVQYRDRLYVKISLCVFLQVERDVMVWNNKRYNSKPLLVKEDHLILKHRRWYSQFYSENSPRLTFQKDDLTF